MLFFPGMGGQTAQVTVPSMGHLQSLNNRSKSIACSAHSSKLPITRPPAYLCKQYVFLQLGQFSFLFKSNEVPNSSWGKHDKKTKEPISKYTGEQCWRSGESTRIPLHVPIWPNFQTRRHVGCICWFFTSPGTPVFPFSQKPTFDLI